MNILRQSHKLKMYNVDTSCYNLPSVISYPFMENLNFQVTEFIVYGDTIHETAY